MQSGRVPQARVAGPGGLGMRAAGAGEVASGEVVRRDLQVVDAGFQACDY